MSLRVPARRGPEAIEWMDAGVGSPAEDAEAYRLLDTVNRWQAGYRLTLEALEAWDPRGPIRFVDVAGGSGEFAAEVEAWGARRGVEVRAVVVDRSPVALAAVRQGGAAGVLADARALPLAPRATDVVHSSCFFHHLGIGEARDLLAEMCRASRGLVIVNDLVRSWVAVAAIRLATEAFVANRLVRNDGPLSVLKAWRPAELLALAHAATADDPGWRWRVARAPVAHRLALVGARLA